MNAMVPVRFLFGKLLRYCRTLSEGSFNLHWPRCKSDFVPKQKQGKIPTVKPKLGDFPLSQKESEERARKGMEKAVSSVFSSPEKGCGPVLQRRMRE